jgi:hypothetical protein
MMRAHPAAREPARMTTATRPTRPTRLSGDELVELLDLMQGADSVELKMTVDLKAQRSAVAALGFDPLEAQIRLVHFFDTPDLALEKAGVVVRARRVQGKGDDTVVKLRPVVPDEIPKKLRLSEDFVIEVDATESGYVCSGSLKGVAAKPIRETTLTGGPVRKIFTKEQRALFAEHAPDGIEMDALAHLGPIFVLKLKGMPEDFPRKLVAELWLFPDGDRILELSTKCAPHEAFQVAAESRGWLAGHGIVPASNQQTKTRKALSFFSKHLDEV